MRSVVVAFAVLVLGACGTDGAAPGGSSPPPSPDVVTAPRLTCAGIETFMVTSGPMGQPLVAEATPAEKADEIVASNENYDRAIRIGLDPDGERFALMKEGAIASELVVARTDEGWVEYSYDSCP